VEGLTLTVPNEIDFTIVDGMLAPGNQPLTAKTTWTLAPGAYTNIAVDAWFATPAQALTASDGSGNAIDASLVVGQINGNGPQAGFGAAAGTPYNSTIAASAAAFPMYEVPVTTNNLTGTGWFSSNLNLFIDSRTTTIPVLTNPTAVYSGYVYVTASAI
jgi:hypothetical protein